MVTLAALAKRHKLSATNAWARAPRLWTGTEASGPHASAHHAREGLRVRGPRVLLGRGRRVAGGPHAHRHHVGASGCGGGGGGACCVRLFLIVVATGRHGCCAHGAHAIVAVVVALAAQPRSL